VNVGDKLIGPLAHNTLVTIWIFGGFSFFGFRVVTLKTADKARDKKSERERERRRGRRVLLGLALQQFSSLIHK
jgi:hypothetical protein